MESINKGVLDNVLKKVLENLRVSKARVFTVEEVTVLENGLIPIADHPDYAIDLQRGSEHYYWLFFKHFNTWQPQRKLEFWEISSVEDQKFYGEQIGRGLRIG